jgi:2-amino-4-hydroxy-6-hydroxymethyldihydropteridine diphosphokinase
VTTPHRAYIGLGSNLGDREANLRGAIDTLRREPGIAVDSVSPLLRSRPMTLPQAEPQPQNEYLNAVAALGTTLSAFDLLTTLQRIEQQYGRTREQRWGPRTLDLDLLLYDNACIHTSELTVPHYGLKERAFVLIPLAHLAPDLVLPDGTPLQQLLREVDRSGMLP